MEKLHKVKVREPPETTDGSLVEGSKNANKRILALYWQPLHDRMHASQRHLRKLNEDIREPGYTKYWRKRYQIQELTKIWKAKQQ